MSIRNYCWLFLPAFLLACGNKRPAGSKPLSGPAVYTCSMHPQIVRDKPGKCPICGMALVQRSAVNKKVDGIDLGALLKPANAFAIANLPVTGMERRSMPIEVKALGFIDYDTRRAAAISARISGRIEKLYVRRRFEPVRVGQKIMDIYSPESQTAQQNFLFLLKSDPDNTTLIEAARQRLLLLGMDTGQLREIERSGKPARTVSVYSSYNGHIHEAPGMPNITGSAMGESAGNRDKPLLTEELSLKEGMYVQKGQTLFDVYDPSRVWGVFYIYADQQGLVHKGDRVDVLPESASPRTIPGKVDFIEPVFGKEQKTLAIRVYFDNARLNLPVGSQVRATIRCAPVQGNWLPNESVVSLGLDKVAFIRTGNGFMAHKVTTGYAYGGMILIIGGLAPTDSVARDGQYLMDSESFIQQPSGPENDKSPHTISHPDSDSAGQLTLSDQQVQLGNIITDTLHPRSLGGRLVLTGTLGIDQDKSTAISIRSMGRVDRLYFKIIGNHVRKGDRIYDLYSEDLNNAKQELIAAVAQKALLDSSLGHLGRLIESAKYKLRLWGMTESQIEEIIRTQKTEPLTPFYSPADGIITSLDINEGDYAMAGATLMRLADLSTVWAEAQVYTSQLAAIDRNRMAEVVAPDLPGKPLRGRIAFVNPEINPGTRIDLVRVSIPNPGGRLKPGMPVYVILQQPGHDLLSLPVDAVIRDGKAAIVWVQTGKNTFASRMVSVGRETGDRIEIRTGLRVGDIVVINGAYLINSEYIFRQGSNPMSGMKK